MARRRADYYPDSSRLVYWAVPSVMNIPGVSVEFYGVELNVVDPDDAVVDHGKRWYRGWRLFLTVPRAGPHYGAHAGMMRVVFQRRLFPHPNAPQDDSPAYVVRHFGSRAPPRRLKPSDRGGHLLPGDREVECDSVPDGVDLELFELHFLAKLREAFKMAWDWFDASASRDPRAYLDPGRRAGNFRRNPRR